MKKFITMLTALVCVAALAISASAAEFIPSVVQKNDAPAVVSATMNGNNIELRTTNLENASGEIKAQLEKAYNDLSQKKVTDLVSAADLQKAAGNTKIEDLVVKSLFDASMYENNVVVNADGSVTFTIKTDLKPGTTVVVLHYFHDDWEVIAAENVKLADNGELTITCPNGLSPFAILVDSSNAASVSGAAADGKVSPKTGETVSVPAAAACAAFVVLAGAAVVLGKKKSA